MATKKAYTDADLKPFGRRLKLALEEAGYTPTSFARAAELPPARMTTYLYEAIRGVAFDHLQRMTELTGVRAEWLAFGKEPMRGEPTSPFEMAAASARRYGVPEAVVQQVYRHFEGATWDAQQWLQVMMQAHRRSAENSAWFAEFRRVKMIRDAQRAAKAEVAAEKRSASIKEGTFTVEDALKELVGT